MRYLFLFICFLPTSVFACTCGSSPSFCSYTADYFDYTNDSVSVAHVRFLNLRNPTTHAFLYDFERITTIAGIPVVDTISLWGQDGINCNGPIMGLDIDTEYIVMFPARAANYLRRLDSVPNLYPIYDYPGCGPATLTVTDGMVLGRIAEGVTQLSLGELTEAMMQCQEEGTVSNRTIVAASASAIAYPNPAHEVVTITTTTALDGNTVRLLDLSGRILSVQIAVLTANSLRISLTTLPAGVYVVLVDTPLGTVRKRIVKQ